MIGFSLPPEVVQLQMKVRTFIDDHIVPYERDPRIGPHGPTEELRFELNALARNAGLISPHAPLQYGGLGLNHLSMAVIFEAAGWSTLGPVALNIQAPDEGNVNLLNLVGTTEQKERWLPEIVSGEMRTVFSMTETATGGAGSDPSLLNTTAQRDGDRFIITGRKYMITGFPGAGLNIIMANARDEDGNDLGATMFLSDMGADGCKLVRMLDTLDSNSPGGHAEVEFEGLKVPAENVLGAVGEGFRYAQVRLGPARLTHCMRWLGAAVRCHAIAADHARNRKSFGKVLGEHQGVGFMLADNEMDLHLARLAIWHAAWLLDNGDKARNETSMVKVFCSEALGRVVDRCVQILGSIGITTDTVVERVYRDIRPFRIYDGPSEVHRHALARRVLASSGRAGLQG